MHRLLWLCELIKRGVCLFNNFNLISIMHSHITPTNSPDGITECFIFNWNYPVIAFYGVAWEYRNSYAVCFYLYMTQNGIDEMKGWEELMDDMCTHGCIQPGLTNSHRLSRYTLFPSWRRRRVLITSAMYVIYYAKQSSLSGKYSFMF